MLRLLPRLLALLDEFPELSIAPELIVFCQRQFAAEKKVPKRVLVQDSVHRDPLAGARKINPVIFRAITIKLFPFALNQPESTVGKLIKIIRQNLELGQKLKLQGLRQGRHFTRAQFVKYDLKHQV